MPKGSANLTQVRRERLLKLLSMNLNDMEANSGMEHLVAFKRAYGASVQAIQNCLRRFCPEMEEKKQQDFTFSFRPFIYGIYPYAAVTEKQRDAMEQAQVDFQYRSIYEISLLGTKRLLGI